MKKLILIFMFVFGIDAQAGFWHDLADGVIHATNIAADVCVNQQVNAIARKLDQAAYKVSRISSQVSSYHYRYFTGIQSVLHSMSYEWHAFIADYNRYYMLSVADLDDLNSILDDMLCDLDHMRLCYSCDYTRDLQDIEYALRNASAPVVSRWSGSWNPCTIRYIADDLARAEDILHFMH